MTTKCVDAPQGLRQSCIPSLAPPLRLCLQNFELFFQISLCLLSLTSIFIIVLIKRIHAHA